MIADPAGIAVRFSLYLALALLFGLPCFALQALRGDECGPRGPLRLDRILPALAVLAALLSAAQIALLAASMSGTDLAGIDGATLLAVLSAGSLGLAWKLRMLALAAILIVSLGWRRRPAQAPPIFACFGAIALTSLAWAGHGAMDDGSAGWVHLAADLLHLLAAGLWLGALAGLVLLLARPSATAGHLALCARALTGFARTGTLIVATLALTGAVNLWALVGPSGLRGLPATGYGRLLLAKLALFAAMLLLAAANRFRLAPGLARSLAGHAGAQTAIRRLRLSLAIETGCIIAILLLVAWLGLLPPTGDV